MGCCSSKRCPVCTVGYWLVMIGALNWGLVGVGYFVGTNLNVVNLILGTVPVVESVVYVLIGLSAVFAIGKFCKKDSCISAHGGAPGGSGG